MEYIKASCDVGRWQQQQQSAAVSQPAGVCVAIGSVGVEGVGLVSVG